MSKVLLSQWNDELKLALKFCHKRRLFRKRCRSRSGFVAVKARRSRHPKTRRLASLVVTTM